MAEIDWRKPIQTRDGRKARVWDEPLRDGRRIVVVEGHDRIEGFCARGPDGTAGCLLTKHDDDIINVPEPERWLVFRQYLGGIWIEWEGRSEADARGKAADFTAQVYIAKLIPVEPEKESD